MSRRAGSDGQCANATAFRTQTLMDGMVNDRLEGPLGGEHTGRGSWSEAAKGWGCAGRRGHPRDPDPGAARASVGGSHGAGAPEGVERQRARAMRLRPGDDTWGSSPLHHDGSTCRGGKGDLHIIVVTQPDSNCR